MSQTNPKCPMVVACRHETVRQALIRILADAELPPEVIDVITLPQLAKIRTAVHERRRRAA